MNPKKTCVDTSSKAPNPWKGGKKRGGHLRGVHDLAGGRPDASERPESGFGCARGLITMSADFDDPLDDFSDYV